MERSRGSFIYASTLVKFIASEDKLPQDQVTALLANDASPLSSSFTVWLLALLF